MVLIIVLDCILLRDNKLCSTRTRRVMNSVTLSTTVVHCSLSSDTLLMEI